MTAASDVETVGEACVAITEARLLVESLYDPAHRPERPSLRTTELQLIAGDLRELGRQLQELYSPPQTTRRP